MDANWTPVGHRGKDGKIRTLPNGKVVGVSTVEPVASGIFPSPVKAKEAIRQRAYFLGLSLTDPATDWTPAPQSVTA